MNETQTPLGDAIAKLDTLPKAEAEIGIVAREGGDVGVVGQVSKPLGKGWSVAAAGQWMKQTGWAVAGKLGWKGGTK